MGLGFALAVGCKNDDEEPPTPAESFCAAVAAQAASCGAGTPCDEALVTDCAGVAGLFNDSLLTAAATCVEEGGNPLGCVVDSRDAIEKSAAHEAFGAAFCSECALGIPGCEETLFGSGGDDDLAIVGALITPLGDTLVTELQTECASGLTCLATFSTCAQEVLARQALPTETLTCVVEQLTSGGGGSGGSSCAATGEGSAESNASNSMSEEGTTDPSETDSDASTAGDTTTEGESSAGSSESGASEESDSSGVAPSDPEYPNPFVDDCPGGTDHVGPADTTLGFCAPLCIGGTCPAPATGDASAECVLSPLSSFDPCMVEDDCIEAETCMANACVVLPATHCGLLCDGGQTCPDGMLCDGGLCLYSS